MQLYTHRRRNILTGSISILLVFSAVTIGIAYAFGAFDDGYDLTGTFDAAGQGLIEGSDVKIRGVDVGEVSDIQLVDGEAHITMEMKNDEKVPVGAEAVIRPKTLFGEKFVDIAPGPNEGDGPFMGDGDEIEKTLGGFELERVLADTFPLLEAIDPVEVATILDSLAEGGDGLGEAINRTIVNSETLTSLAVDNDALTRQLLTDLAALSETLGESAGTLVEGAGDLNRALPVLTENSDELTALLEQASRLSNDVADLMYSNRGFIEASFVEGSKTLDVLDAHTDRVVPLVIGLRQYLQALSVVVRFELADGSLMAAVKGITGAETCALLPCDFGQNTTAASPGAGPPATTAPLVPEVPLDVPLDQRSDGPGAIVDILGEVLGG